MKLEEEKMELEEEIRRLREEVRRAREDENHKEARTESGAEVQSKILESCAREKQKDKIIFKLEAEVQLLRMESQARDKTISRLRGICSQLQDSLKTQQSVNESLQNQIEKFVYRNVSSEANAQMNAMGLNSTLPSPNRVGGGEATVILKSALHFILTPLSMRPTPNTLTRVVVVRQERLFYTQICQKISLSLGGEAESRKEQKIN
ncbi:hypothetical protein TSTA_110250 [Talaromyces stipitatus ATCC 10500]|uniref:Uncharacterized protein n=1 Tax=Talaromyces stipitatus (strain ATCC 10500 / CBS 375.48 / QM 6759 / NRRL 1006) TaxID=441959 RepID=B8MUH3_TALSN|nr:uncharacterized protein TSTA_110250 [Talaromyces stipitatus ATCC 10500]EED11845.1 hypothetical protein TSTA_110250 [Talaromyces stipitatus ATCC 10500]